MEQWLFGHVRAVLDSVLYSVLGALVLLVSFWVVEKLLPFSLTKEIAEDHNIGARHHPGGVRDRDLDDHLRRHPRLAGRSAPGPAMRSPLVYLTVLVIATCGLVYELVAGTLASYVLGDSVTQFSTVIGVYLSALGLGS